MSKLPFEELYSNSLYKYGSRFDCGDSLREKISKMAINFNAAAYQEAVVEQNSDQINVQDAIASIVYMVSSQVKAYQELTRYLAWLRIGEMHSDRRGPRTILRTFSNHLLTHP